jgi:hypothetical protein
MKKSKSRDSAGLRSEYSRTDFPAQFFRGKYAKRLSAVSNIVKLKPEISAAFPTSAAVNAALAEILRKSKTDRSAPRPGARVRDK